MKRRKKEMAEKVRIKREGQKRLKRKEKKAEKKTEEMERKRRYDK